MFRDGLADLQVTDIHVPAGAIAGQPLDVSYTVRNSGDNRTNANFWYDALYLSNDANTSDHVLIGKVRHVIRSIHQGNTPSIRLR